MTFNPLLHKAAFVMSALICGIIAAFSMPSASLWPLLFIGLSGLYYLYAKTPSAFGAFGCGFFFALGYFITGLWWIGNALLVEGNEYAWVWPLSVIGLPTLLAFFTATYLGIARMIKTPDTIGGFFIFALFLTLSEWARGNAFTGFPWNLYGYVWSDYLPMAQSFYYFGAYGFTSITILWAAMTGFLIVTTINKKSKIIIASISVLSIVLVYGAGHLRLSNNPTLFDTENGIVVVQPNIAQNMKWDENAAQDNFLNTIKLSSNAKFKSDAPPKNIMIVWPETAISPFIYGNPDNVNIIKSTLDGYNKSNAYLITGILRRLQNDDRTTAYTNSIALLNKSFSAVNVYDKHHLVPFGEFIPLQDYIPLTPVAAFKGFERGHGIATIERDSIPPFSPLVCYEIIFPNQVALPAPNKPRWIVNSTNDGWYGNSAGPRQHFAQTRLRAIEEGMPVIRSANTGISGIFDSYGRVVAHAEIFEEASLTSYLPMPIEKQSPFFPKFFPYALLICGLCLMLQKLFLQKSKL